MGPLHDFGPILLELDKKFDILLQELSPANMLRVLAASLEAHGLDHVWCGFGAQLVPQLLCGCGLCMSALCCLSCGGLGGKLRHGIVRTFGVARGGFLVVFPQRCYQLVADLLRESAMVGYMLLCAV